MVFRIRSDFSKASGESVELFTHAGYDLGLKCQPERVGAPNPLDHKHKWEMHPAATIFMGGSVWPPWWNYATMTKATFSLVP